MTASRADGVCGRQARCSADGPPGSFACPGLEPRNPATGSSASRPRRRGTRNLPPPWAPTSVSRTIRSAGSRKPKSDQRAHGSRKRPSGQVPAPGCKTGSDPTNLPASRAARHHPTHPQARTDPERRTTDGVTPAGSPPARAEDFTRTRPAPMSTAVKPSAQPTLVRTQHLPPPAKTAPWLRKRGPAGRFVLVTPCIRVRHYGSMRGGVHVHMVSSARAKLAVRITVRSGDLAAVGHAKEADRQAGAGRLRVRGYAAQ